MGRKEQAAAPPRRLSQTVPDGFEPLSNASVYSRHIGPSYARKEVDGATLIQPTLPHMCNSGGVLHGGYMMSFADSAVTRAAGIVTGMAPSTVSFAAEFLAAGDANSPLVTRVEVPRHGSISPSCAACSSRTASPCSPIRRRSFCARKLSPLSPLPR